MPLFPSGNGLQMPTNIKTIADSADYFIGIDSTGTLFKIAKSDLFASFSSETGNSPSDINLTFATSGDTNGIFYYLGTARKTQDWVNPTNIGLLVSASSIEHGSVASLVNRDESEFYTGNLPNSWVSFNIAIAGKLKCNYYSIRVRNSTAYYPRNWKLQGSNDGSTWNDLDIQTNNIILNTASQWLSIPLSSPTAYSVFRILNYGVDSEGSNYFCLGEVELYGSFST